MSLTKKEIWRRLNELEEKAAEMQEKARQENQVELWSALIDARIEFLQKVLAEAKQRYGFNGLSDLVAFLVNHSSEISPKSDEKRALHRA